MLDGKITFCWKLAEVKSIFKKGNTNSPGNYRPVSLTSIVCKIFEGFVRDALNEHFTKNRLLFTEQFVFCKGHFCTSQLLGTVNEWVDSLDTNIPTDANYLNFAKAFYTVPRGRLLKTLN